MINGLRHSQRHEDRPIFSVFKNRPEPKLRASRGNTHVKRHHLHSNCVVLGNIGAALSGEDVALGQSC